MINPPIIHRDIKPLNLLVTEDDTVKITDFGIAKVLDAGQNASTVVKGTPVYMSPEQILNPKSVDIRTDVYSLGMTFYEMLCGRTPFSGDTTTTPTAVYAAIINSEVPPPTHFYPGITEALSDFVMKAIHKDRNQRFSDANEMLRKLEELERSGDTIFEDISKIVPAFEEEEPEPINNRELKQVTNTSRENRIQRRKWFIEIAAVCLIFLAVGLPWQQIFEKVVESIKQDSIPLVEKTSLLTSNQMKEMVVVDGGTFMMGTNDGKYDYDKPVHEVTVGSFLIGKYEVTQDFWESIMGSNPSEFKSGKKPVENVSWYDAIEFCNKLSEKEGLQKAYKIDRSKKDPNNNSEDDKVKWVVTCDFNSNGYRLPTEAEWEFAAKGGNQSKGYKYSGSNDIDEVAWYSKNTNKTTQDIGIKHPNELEIFDMSGNIWEWCWEWNGDYTSQSQTNPKGAKTGTFRVLRGGVWMLEDIYCRAAHSYGDVPDARVSIFGFRLARTKN